MDAFLNSFVLVFFSEMGDKTQLLALILTARYRKPWVILAGIFVATLLNHALASWVGGWAASYVSPGVLRWGLAILFWGFAIWLLIPDSEEEISNEGRLGPFLTTLITFFLAEMGDKTQLATLALGAKYASITLVTIGSTLGMMASNSLAVFFGDRLLKKISMKWMRVIACVIFIVFGVAILVGF